MPDSALPVAIWHWSDGSGRSNGCAKSASPAVARQRLGRTKRATAGRNLPTTLETQRQAASRAKVRVLGIGSQWLQQLSVWHCLQTRQSTAGNVSLFHSDCSDPMYELRQPGRQ